MSERVDPMLDALKGFVITEMEGHQFYRLAADKTEDTRGRKMFLSLANDELDHARKLSSEYSSVSTTGHWLSTDELKQQSRQPEEPFAPMFPTEPEEIEKMVPKAASDLEALKIAIDMEKESIERYAKAAAEVPDDAAKALFQHLVAEERQHLKIVENSYDYLADTGSWFQDMEKPIFEG